MFYLIYFIWVNDGGGRVNYTFNIIIVIVVVILIN